MPWAIALGIALVTVATAGYAFNSYQVRRQRRELRFITHQERQRLQWWRTVFLITILGACVGLVVAVLSGLLLA